MAECTRSEIKDRLPDYVNGTLRAADRAEVEAHIAACASCGAEAILLRAARGAIVRRTPVVDVARISVAVRKAGAPPRATATTVARPRMAFVWKTAAAALLVAGAAYGGYAIRGNPIPVPPHMIAVIPAPNPPPSRPTRPDPTRRPNTSTSTKTSPASLTFGGVDELSPEQAAAIMKQLDRSAPTLDAEPEGDIALETGS